MPPRFPGECGKGEIDRVGVDAEVMWAKSFRLRRKRDQKLVVSTPSQSSRCSRRDGNGGHRISNRTESRREGGWTSRQKQI